MPTMLSIHLLASLVATVEAMRSSPENTLLMDEADDDFQKCPRSIFNFCSHADLADHGHACIASTDATPHKAEEVQCVPKKNNPNGTYVCAKHLSHQCDATPITTVVPLRPASQTGTLLEVAPKEDFDLPLYCGLAQMAMNKISNQPLTKDLAVSTVVKSMMGLNNYKVVLTDFELGTVAVANCDTHMNKEKDVLSVEVSKLEAEILSFGWASDRVSWPHFPESGTIEDGKMGASFDVSLDLVKEEEVGLHFSLDQIDVNVGAVGHEWLSKALNELVKLARPVVSEAMQLAARYELDKALEVVRTQGGCMLLEKGLELLEPVTLQFQTKEPISYHVPLVGNILTSVNSTRIDLPKSMNCMRANFTGTAITFHIKDFEFGAAFDWAYRKEDSKFWHNSGTGSVNAKVGVALHVDVENPAATEAHVALPEMHFSLNSEYDNWFYSTLPKVMSPFIKGAINTLGSHFAKYEIKKTLKKQFKPLS